MLASGAALRRRNRRRCRAGLKEVLPFAPRATRTRRASSPSKRRGRQSNRWVHPEIACDQPRPNKKLGKAPPQKVARPVRPARPRLDPSRCGRGAFPDAASWAPSRRGMTLMARPMLLLGAKVENIDARTIGVGTLGDPRFPNRTRRGVRRLDWICAWT